YLLDSVGISINDRELSPETMNETGWIPIQRAAIHGHLEPVKLLVERGALAAERAEAYESDSPVALAAHYGHEKVLKHLLEHGAKVDGKMASGLTALHIMASKGSMDSVRKVLSHGASVDVRSDDGSTPLLLATRHGHMGAVQVLRCAGADPNAGNLEGKTPIDIASSAGRDDLKDILQKPECVSLTLLETLEEESFNITKTVKTFLKKLEEIYGDLSQPVYTGTALQEVFRKMGESAQPHFLPYFIDTLHIPNLRFEASLALRQFPADVVMPTLVAALKSKDPDIRLRVLEVIAALESDGTKRYVDKMLEDKDAV
ncbi:MAG: ankyrin repeat domain-containing protein, partial [Candidatus Hodarchaeota archaeon]